MLRIFYVSIFLEVNKVYTKDKRGDAGVLPFFVCSKKEKGLGKTTA